jgi:hypothetical protein
MTMITLVAHIILSLITLVLSVGVIGAVYMRRERSSLLALKSMWVSFCGVALSGILLIMMTPGSLGRSCAMMSLYIIMTTAVHLYQKRAFMLPT